MTIKGTRMLTSFSLRYPKTILSFWVAFFIVFGFFAWKLPGILKDHGLTPGGGDFAYVQQVAASDFHIPDAPVFLVFEKKPAVSDAAFRRSIALTLNAAAGTEGLVYMQSPLDREGMMKGNYAYALLSFEQKPYEMKPVLAALQKRLPNLQDVTVSMTGKTVVQEEVNRASKHDLKLAELIGVPAAFLILWLAFGGILTALLPVIIGVVAVTGTMGILYGLGTRIELSNFVLNVVPMVGLALSIDFALMVVSRFREELSDPTLSVERALTVTMQTAGRAVLFSACCFLLGLTGLLLIPLPIFTTVALGAIAVTAISATLTVTLLPALLALFGPAIETETRRQPHRLRANDWRKWADYVMRHPLRIFVLASLLLLGCLLPLNRMELAIPDATSLPEGSASRHAMEVMQSQLGQSANSSLIYVLAEGASTQSFSAEDWQAAAALVHRLEQDPQVRQVDSVFSALQMKPKPLSIMAGDPHYGQAIAPFVQHNRMLIHVTLNGRPDSEAAMEWVRNRDQAADGSGFSYRLGGEVKYQQEVFDAVRGNMGYVLLFIVVSNYIVLFLAFRSVLIPIKALVMNFLSLGAAFGLLTWIFRQGFPGLEPYSIAIMIPIFIFGLAFGMSMDYGVFLLARIAENYERTGNNDYAVREGLVSTSRIITSAAAIMIAVTAPFAFGDVVGVKQLGIGIAAAIAIDATVIRLMVVPSLMTMMGHWNWWAPRL